MIPSSVVDTAVVGLVAILVILAAFQIALAAGAPFGRFASGGQHRVLPSRQRWGSVASVAIYTVIAVVGFDRAGRIELLPEYASRIGMWVVFGFFALSVVGNAMSCSRLERSAMVPVTALLAVASLSVALS